MILSLPSGNVVGTSSVQRLASWVRPTFMRYKVPTGGSPTKGIPTPSKTHGNKDNIAPANGDIHHKVPYIVPSTVHKDRRSP